MKVSMILSGKSIFPLHSAHEAHVNKWGKVVQENYSKVIKMYTHTHTHTPFLLHV